MICTTPDCGEPSELYLCNDCIRDLQAWIDRVPVMRAELFITMAKLDKVGTQHGEGGNGMTKEAPLPIREAASAKRTALSYWTHRTAQQLAHDEHAGKYQAMLQKLIEQSERVIDLPPDDELRSPDDIRAQLEPHAPPMPAKECAAYLTQLGVLRITKQDIANWVYHGHLTADEGQGTRTPKYKPTSVLIAYETKLRSNIKYV